MNIMNRRSIFKTLCAFVLAPLSFLKGAKPKECRVVTDPYADRFAQQIKGDGSAVMMVRKGWAFAPEVIARLAKEAERLGCGYFYAESFDESPSDDFVFIFARA